MKISIITICFNSQDSIKKTIESIKCQTYSDFEYIIIDGGSSDNTIDIIKQYNFVDKFISEPDEGIYEAFNKGINIANGEIIGFLNSDDTYYDENSLKNIVDSFNKNTDCVFGDLIFTNKKNEVKRFWKGSEFVNGAFQKGWMPAHPTFYCRKLVYDKYGKFDERFKIAGDFELMLRFLEKNKLNSKYISKTLVNMKMGGKSSFGLINTCKILKEEFLAFKKNKISVNKIFYILHKGKKIKEFRF